jgi:hypothetical protein
VPAVRTRDLHPGHRGDARALRQVHLFALRLPSIRSTAASSPPTSISPTAGSTRRSAGSPRTISASTKGLSWR